MSRNTCLHIIFLPVTWTFFHGDSRWPEVFTLMVHVWLRSANFSWVSTKILVSIIFGSISDAILESGIEMQITLCLLFQIDSAYGARSLVHGLEVGWFCGSSHTSGWDPQCWSSSSTTERIPASLALERSVVPASGLLLSAAGASAMSPSPGCLAAMAGGSLGEFDTPALRGV